MTTDALPRRTYLNHEFGIKSWLLTKDHKRIGLLYLVFVTLAFLLTCGRRRPTTSCSRCTAS
jgi:cytochrome c oxidase subunit 1